MSRKSDDHADEYAKGDKKKKVRSRKSDDDHAYDDVEGGKKKKVRNGKSDDHTDDDAEVGKKEKVRNGKSDDDHAYDDAEGGKKKKARKSDDHPDDHAEGNKEKVRSRKSDDHAEGDNLAEGGKKKKIKRGKKGVVAGKPMKDIFSALKLVLKTAQLHRGLSCGLNQCRKTIERHEAKLCLLAADCDNTDYANKIKALCIDHNVGLISVPSQKTLGEWAGLCKYDPMGNAIKVVSCTGLVVKDFGEDTEALHIVQEFMGI